MFKKLILVLALLSPLAATAQIGGRGGPGVIIYDFGALATPPTCVASYKSFRYYDTDDNTPYFCNGSAWTAFTSVGAITFDEIGTGSNMTATMTCSQGCTITFGVNGIINANQLNGVDTDMSAAAEDDVATINAAGDLALATPGLTARTDADGTVALLSTDRGKQVNASNGTANAISIAQAGTAGFEAGYVAYACQTGAGAATITPTTSTINGAANFTFSSQYACARVRSDGTNYEASLLLPTATSGAPTDAQYVTLATNATLSAERVLTGTASQITVTDNGAGSTVVLSTPQNIATTSQPTFAGVRMNATNQGIDTGSTSNNILIKTIDNSGSLTGKVTVRGGNSSGTSGNTAANAEMLAGDATGATGANTGGSLLLRPGRVTSASGIPGRIQIEGAALDGGTITSGALQCMAADRSVADCATSATNFLGIAIATADPMGFQFAGLNSVAIPADVTAAGRCNGTNCTTVVGDFVCSSANTAGTVQIQATACAAGRQAGIIFVAEATVTSLGVGAVWLQMK